VDELPGLDTTGIDPNLPRGSQDPSQWFNLAAFVNRLAAAPQYRYGNSGRNSITGPGIVDMDLSVIKYWRSSPGTNTYGKVRSTVIDSSQLQFEVWILMGREVPRRGFRRSLGTVSLDQPAGGSLTPSTSRR
jgi:hypothetical protein